MNNSIFDYLKIDQSLIDLAETTQKQCQDEFLKLDKILEYNEAKVLGSFSKNKISESHFVGSTGYGYNDRGRDALDSLFADIVGAEDALVRHNFVSGTHALTVALFGILRPNDTIVSITSSPYDTMEEVIGVGKQSNFGSLTDFGVKYKQVDFLENSTLNVEEIKKSVVGARVCYIQRSCGYSLRKSLELDEMEQIISEIKKVNKDIIVLVDNCYGEFVEKKEPTEIGADLIVGSLIKNPGGSIAETGGYIAGKKDLIELCSYRLTAPGIGKEVGCTFNETKKMMMGLFFAPSVVINALKVSIFTIKFFENLGFETYPKLGEKRTDIITAIKLKTPERLIAFCEGIQKGSPIDSFVSPQPWDMPGYNSQVIMAAGCFTSGASIELSADAPLKEPYVVWVQGGITFNSGKFGVLSAANELLKKNLLK